MLPLTSDTGGVAQHPLSAHASFSLNAFSATPPVSEVSAAVCPRVHPCFGSGITRGYAWCASAGGVRYSALLRPWREMMTFVGAPTVLGWRCELLCCGRGGKDDKKSATPIEVLQIESYCISHYLRRIFCVVPLLIRTMFRPRCSSLSLFPSVE